MADALPRSRTAALAVAVLLIAAVAALVALLSRGGGAGSGLGPQFTYDVSRYERTDPRLIGYSEAAAWPVPFAQARGIATGPDSRVYVAGDSAIAVYGAAGARQGDIRLPAPAMCLAVEADAIYAGMTDHVEVLEPTGASRAAWDRLGGKARLTSIAVASNAVYVADAGAREVLRYSKAGEILGRIRGFIVPSPYLDVAVGPDGLLRVADPGRHRIETYAADGSMLSSWGRPSIGMDGFAGCCNPVHFAMLPSGEFVTSEKGLTRCKVCDPAGKLLCVVAGPEAFRRAGDAGAARGPNDAGGGCDVAVDRAGRVLILDPAAKAVRVFVKKGT